jgi:hypothetical protein
MTEKNFQPGVRTVATLARAWEAIGGRLNSARHKIRHLQSRARKEAVGKKTLPYARGSGGIVSLKAAQSRYAHGLATVATPQLLRETAS